MASVGGSFRLTIVFAREHRVHNGDCLDVLAAMPDASVDVIVTSPPYNLGIAYSLYGDSRDEADYLD